MEHVEIVCMLRFSDDMPLLHAKAEELRMALVAQSKESFPKRRVRACWVHKETKDFFSLAKACAQIEERKVAKRPKIVLVRRREME